MIYGPAKYFIGALCVPKQFQPKVSAVMQHIKDEVVSPSTVHTTMKKTGDNVCTNVGHLCHEKSTKKTQESEMSHISGFTHQFHNPKLSIVMQHLKTEVIPPLAGHCKKIDDNSIIATIEAEIPRENEFNMRAMDYSALLKPEIGDPKDKITSSDKTLINSRSKLDEVPAPQVMEDSFKDTTYGPKFDDTASTITINQQLKDEVVSSLAGNVFEKPNTEDVPLTCMIRNSSQKDYALKTDNPQQFCTNTSEMKEDLNEQVMCPISENILLNKTIANNPVTTMMGDHCGVYTKRKTPTCDVLLKSAGNLKELKSMESTNKKTHFTLNMTAPPVTGKKSLDMQVHLNVRVQADKKFKETTIVPKCQEDNLQKNIENAIHSCVCPKPTQHTTKSSAGDSKPHVIHPKPVNKQYLS